MTTAGGTAYLNDGVWATRLGLAEIRHLMPGDANGDGTVDVHDLNMVLTNYDKTGMTWSTAISTATAPWTSDDLNVVLTNYDTTGQSAAGTRPFPSLRRLPCSAIGVVLQRRR